MPHAVVGDLEDLGVAVVAEADRMRPPSGRSSFWIAWEALISRLRITWLIWLATQGTRGRSRRGVDLDRDLGLAELPLAISRAEATSSASGTSSLVVGEVRAIPRRFETMLATRCTPSRVRLEQAAEVVRGRTSQSRSSSTRSTRGQRLGGRRRPGRGGPTRSRRPARGGPQRSRSQDGEVVGDVGQRVVDLVGDAGAEQADRGQLLALDEHVAHPLPLGQVADRADELDGVPRADGVERQLQRELLAVLAAAAQLDGAADEPGGGPGAVGALVAVVAAAEAAGVAGGSGDSGRPRTSSASKPKVRSAAGLNRVIRPSASATTTASSVASVSWR